MKFIEVTKEMAVGREDYAFYHTYLNVDNIIYFYENGTGSIIQTADGDRIWVAESPAEICILLREGG